MRRALEQAQHAFLCGEVPVGAVVVQNKQIIATGYNRPITEHDPTAHAEIVAMRAAAQIVGNYRLTDCDLYVTLEPCAMCAMAMLHARFRRVIFGAPDPKTGAAGSVLDIFANEQLNHQTAITGGVLADASGQVLRDFFKMRRELNTPKAPLRDDALRTPDHAFDGLPGYDFAPNYIADLPTLSSLRMHYLDENQDAANDQQLTFLCLHGNPAWSYLYRHMLPVFTAAGHRVLAPDLIGFGRSDKLKKAAAHTFEFHRNSLLELVEWLDLRNIVLVVQDWGGILGLTLPMVAPERYRGVIVMNTALATGLQPLTLGFTAWRDYVKNTPDYVVSKLFKRSCPQLSANEAAAYDAPFLEAGMRAALHAFPQLVPEYANSPGAELGRQAQDFWRNDWAGASFMAIGAQDPVLGEAVMRDLAATIRGCPAPLLLPHAGHFTQEWGAEVAHAALQSLAIQNI
jgi:tRNA(adenine34) deaminase